MARTVTGAACHVYQRATRFRPPARFPDELPAAGSELWVLHPAGEPLPCSLDRVHEARQPHVMLLDGTWRQAGEMLRTVEGRGRCVCLPQSTPESSRYWLREQTKATHLSTAETLMGVFRVVGEDEAEQRLRLHFELHVYATLLARGRRDMAERYLVGSPLPDAAPRAIERLRAGRGNA